MKQRAAMFATIVVTGCAPALTPIPTYWDPVVHVSPGGVEAWPELEPEAATGYRQTLDAFGLLAHETGGRLYESERAPQTVPLVARAMSEGIAPGAPVDIAFVVDTTASMYDEIQHVRWALDALVDELAASNPDWRVAVIEYRDVDDAFAARISVPITSDKRAVIAGVDALRVSGGGDYCEHVHAGLAVALDDVAWRASAERRIILIGDAPPHERPGWVPDRRSVLDVARARHVRVFAIGTHCGKACLARVRDGC